jgi:hypothetical protein
MLRLTPDEVLQLEPILGVVEADYLSTIALPQASARRGVSMPPANGKAGAAAANSELHSSAVSDIDHKPAARQRGRTGWIIILTILSALAALAYWVMK